MIVRDKPPANESGHLDEKVSRVVKAQLRKREFGKRVNRARQAKGWNQAELGRKADLPRYTINSYIQGVSLPEPENLYKLAAALGVEPHELLPPEGEPMDVLETLTSRLNPAAVREISILANGRSRLRINQVVSTVVGMRIIEMLNDDEIADRDRSSGPAKK